MQSETREPTEEHQESWSEYARGLRERLDVWEERLDRLQKSPAMQLNNRRMAEAIGSLQMNAQRVRHELEVLERARTAGRPRKWLAIRNEIEARLRAMDRDWERRPAA